MGGQVHEPLQGQPAIGRWLSRDPAGESADPQGNLYAYVGGNPVSVNDAQGLGPGGCLGGLGLELEEGAGAEEGLAVGPGAAALAAPAIEVGLELGEALAEADAGEGIAAGLADAAADAASGAAADSAAADAVVGAAGDVGAGTSADAAAGAEVAAGAEAGEGAAVSSIRYTEEGESF
ncbi:MAG: RHS repeat-associated core domain-containing protein, partial [Caulobacteraceae bacterium]